MPEKVALLILVLQLFPTEFPNPGLLAAGHRLGFDFLVVGLGARPSDARASASA
jgi:hypothetical protein